MLLGVQGVWGNKPSHSQVNSHCRSWSPKWTPKSSERNYKGQNPLAWNVIYIIGKILKCIYLKWACIAHLSIWNTSYDQKKGQESNWQFDFRPLKVGNWFDFVTCRWHATYHWKALYEAYNFSLYLIAIECLHVKLCARKVVGDPFVRISRQNAISMWPSWRGVEYTIRGKVVASPKSGLWWVLWVRVAHGLF